MKNNFKTTLNNVAENKNQGLILDSRLKISLLVLFLIVSGCISIALSRWNLDQSETLLKWAADREGKTVFTRIIHESGYSPGMFFRNPAILKEIVGSESSVIGAGIMMGEKVIASFSQIGFEKELGRVAKPEIGSAIIDSEFTVFRKFTGPGSGGGGRWHGAGQGPPWMRETTVPEQNSDKNDRMSFFIVFRGPDRKMIAPLVYQSYLWPIVWFAMTFMWVGILFVQNRLAVLHQKMQKESHMASVGKMSARLAHEIKNPLGAVRGMAQLLNRKLNDSPDLKPMTETIENETFRLETLTRSILDFSNPTECQLVKLNLKSTVADSVNFFKSQHEKFKIVLKLPDNDVFCLYDSNSMHQIILNLLKNAADEAGTNDEIQVILETSNGLARLQFLNPGQLSDEVEKNKFEPFFSTKTRGYGLGLPICKKLAEQQNGSLKLVNLNKNTVMAEVCLNEEI